MFCTSNSRFLRSAPVRSGPTAAPDPCSLWQFAHVFSKYGRPRAASPGPLESNCKTALIRPCVSNGVAARTLPQFFSISLSSRGSSYCRNRWTSSRDTVSAGIVLRSIDSTSFRAQLGRLHNNSMDRARDRADSVENLSRTASGNVIVGEVAECRQGGDLDRIGRVVRQQRQQTVDRRGRFRFAERLDQRRADRPRASRGWLRIEWPLWRRPASSV